MTHSSVMNSIHIRRRSRTFTSALERYVRHLMEGVESHADQLLGQGALRTLCSGETLEINEAPALGLPEKPRLFVTHIEHVGMNDLPAGLQSELHKALGSPEFLLRFDSAPCFAPSPLSRTDVLGMTPAVLADGNILADNGFSASAFPGFSDADSGFAATTVFPRNTEHPDAKTLARAKETGYGNLFSGNRHERLWRPPLISAQGTRLHAKTRIHGVHSALVVGAGGESTPEGENELYCNARGDIRLRFHWQTQDSATGVEGDSRADNRTTRWVRVASYQAGPGMGWQTLPRIGQEVLVRFADDDPEQPIVVGAVYNGRGEGGHPPTPGGKRQQNEHSTVDNFFALARDNSPSAQYNSVQSGTGGHAPAWHGQSREEDGHRNAAALSGFKSKAFGGAAFNQLVFDDTDRRLRIQAHSSTATSQLNLGHLIHQADNYRGSFRGEGFELRSDAYTAIRGGQGVLLSTWHDPVPEHNPIPEQTAGDATPVIALARQMNRLSTTLHESARQHRAVGLAASAGTTQQNTSRLNPEMAPLAALEQSLKGTTQREDLTEALADASARQTETGRARIPHSNDPIIALAGKGGIAATAGKHLQWTAGETLALGTLTHFNLTAGKRLRVHAGQAIGVLAGAEKPDCGDTALDIVAAQDDITVQAQHEMMELFSSDDLTLQSETSHIDFAAAKRIHIATAEGASITIEGGNITFECPGKITIYRTALTVKGPRMVPYGLPQFPISNLKPKNIFPFSQ
jgi:uncharacterized protein involved in type VI secretion and phage assembly